jgi:hypothetical protein
MHALIRSRVAARWRPVLALVLAVFLPQIGRHQTAASVGIANQPGATMNTFVIIFRQGPRTLTDADKQRRAEETTVWARVQNEAGHKLDPRILTPEHAHRGPERDRPGDDWAITALLFLEATDLNEAARIAEAHPALRYGASVEVRPWAPPVAAATGAPAAPPR